MAMHAHSVSGRAFAQRDQLPLCAYCSGAANTLQPRLDGCLCEQHRRWASLNVPTPSHGLHAMHSLERQIFSLPVKPQRVQEANPEVVWPSSSRPGPTSGVLVHSKFVMAVVDVFSCPERFYLFDEMLATSHSMPEESPSPVLAEHGWMCHTRSRMLCKPSASVTSSGGKAFNRSCLLAKSSSGTPASFSSCAGHRRTHPRQPRA